MMAELWRPIPGYIGLYSVSNLGRVKSLARRGAPSRRYGRRGYEWPERILRERIGGSDRYPRVALHTPGERRQRGIATLVLRAFVGFCPVGCEASHLDGDKLNSKLINLVWEPHVQNMARQIEHGTRPRGERRGSAKLTEADVRVIRASDKPNGELSAEYGVSRSTISAILRREKWKHVA